MAPRCPNGTRRNKKTGLCEKTPGSKARSSPPPPAAPPPPPPAAAAADSPPAAAAADSPPHKGRCPTGTFRNKKTGRCEPKVKKGPHAEPPLSDAELIRRIRAGTANKSKLNGISFLHEDFDEVNLSRAKMTQSNMRDVGFQSSQLDSVLFDNSKFSDVELANTNIANTKFHNCELKDVMLVKCQLKGSSFKNSNLVDCEFDNIINLSHSTFKGATFKNVVFRDTIPSLDAQQRANASFIYKNAPRGRQAPPPPSQGPRQASPVNGNPGDVVWTETKARGPIGCPSRGLKPARDCAKYKKQSLVFHPDKNTSCPEDSSAKLKLLNQWCR